MFHSTGFRSAVISLLRFGAAFCVAHEAVGFGQTMQFESPAQLHRTLKKPLAGQLVFDESGVEFRSQKLSLHWAFSDIKTFTLSGPRRLEITDYENRHWHEPGEQNFSFDLSTAIPPEVAGRLADRVGRPVINGDPVPKPATLAEIPAHRRKFIGGSNGVLRFREDGIDYVTPDGEDAHNWRWSDIQTIANSDPWQFRVGAYRDIVEFDLKTPMSHDLFNRLWDKLYAGDLNLSSTAHGGHQ